MRKVKRRDRVGGGQAQRSIIYRDHKRPHDKRSVTVTVPKTEIIDERRAAGIVALRTGTALEDVRIVSIGNR